MLVQDLPHFFEGMTPIHGEGRANGLKTQERDSWRKIQPGTVAHTSNPGIPEVRQEDHEFGASAVNIVRSSLKNLES